MATVVPRTKIYKLNTVRW